MIAVLSMLAILLISNVQYVHADGSPQEAVLTDTLALSLQKLNAEIDTSPSFRELVNTADALFKTKDKYRDLLKKEADDAIENVITAIFAKLASFFPAAADKATLEIISSEIENLSSKQGIKVAAKEGFFSDDPRGIAFLEKVTSYVFADETSVDGASSVLVPESRSLPEKVKLLVLLAKIPGVPTVLLTRIFERSQRLKTLDRHAVAGALVMSPLLSQDIFMQIYTEALKTLDGLRNLKDSMGFSPLVNEKLMLAFAGPDIPMDFFPKEWLHGKIPDSVRMELLNRALLQDVGDEKKVHSLYGLAFSSFADTEGLVRLLQFSEFMREKYRKSSAHKDLSVLAANMLEGIASNQHLDKNSFEHLVKLANSLRFFSKRQAKTIVKGLVQSPHFETKHVIHFTDMFSKSYQRQEFLKAAAQNPATSMAGLEFIAQRAKAEALPYLAIHRNAHTNLRQKARELFIKEAKELGSKPDGCHYVSIGIKGMLQGSHPQEFLIELVNITRKMSSPWLQVEVYEKFLEHAEFGPELRASLLAALQELPESLTRSTLEVLLALAH